MRVLVCGGRDWTDPERTARVLDALPFTPSMVIHGGARGADLAADAWAKRSGVPTVRCDALWSAHGKGAGPKRNVFMLEQLHPGYCVAFPGGRGTADMVRRCEAAGLVVWRPYG